MVAVRHDRGWLAAAVLGLVVLVLIACTPAGAIHWSAHHSGTPTTVAASRPTTDHGPTSTHTGTGPMPDPFPGAVRGRDFSVDMVSGRVAHWGCTTPITVELVGSTPPGAQNVLVGAVARLAAASRLPLQVGTPVRTATQYTTQKVTVSYANRGSQVGGLALTGPGILGLGGPSFGTDGVITSGAILIARNQGLNTPGTVAAQRTMMHELGHALGLGHSAEGPTEIMAATSSNTSTATLGPGDRHALWLIGCR